MCNSLCVEVFYSLSCQGFCLYRNSKASMMFFLFQTLYVNVSSLFLKNISQHYNIWYSLCSLLEFTKRHFNDGKKFDRVLANSKQVHHSKICRNYVNKVSTNKKIKTNCKEISLPEERPNMHKMQKPELNKYKNYNITT